MIGKFALCCSLAGALAAPAFAQQAAPDPAKPVKEKKICRREADTGSYIPKSTCHTKEEWQAIDKQSGPDAASIDRFRHNFGHGRES